MVDLGIVLFSTDYLPNIGGVATHVYELAKAMMPEVAAIEVVTVKYGRWRDPRTWISRRSVREGLATLEIPMGCVPRGLGNSRRLAYAVMREYGRLRRKAHSVIYHCHDYDDWGHLANRMRFYDANVFTNHTSMFLQDVETEEGRKKWSAVLAPYDHIIAPSKELALKTEMLGINKDRISYIPNGVDIARFQPDGKLRAIVRQKMGVPQDAILVLCVRRFVPKNGVIDFAHSLRFIPRCARPIYAVFIGNSEHPRDSYELETLGALVHGPREIKVLLLGQIPNSSMSSYYAAADIGVLPSLKEAVSITGLETMACGVPIVGTRVGGIPDLIAHGQDGLLVDAGDPRGFAEALQLLIYDPDLRGKLGRNARRKMVEQFSWQYVVGSTLQVYQKALSSSPA